MDLEVSIVQPTVTRPLIAGESHTATWRVQLAAAQGALVRGQLLKIEAPGVNIVADKIDSWGDETYGWCILSHDVANAVGAQTVVVYVKGEFSDNYVFDVTNERIIADFGPGSDLSATDMNNFRLALRRFGIVLVPVVET